MYGCFVSVCISIDAFLRLFSLSYIACLIFPFVLSQTGLSEVYLGVEIIKQCIYMYIEVEHWNMAPRLQLLIAQTFHIDK